jgi:hypothetical protein
MTDKIYSYDGEMFQYETLGELIDNYADEICIGDVVYVAEKRRPRVASYIDVGAMLEQMCEWAYDSHDCEESDAWPDLSVSETNELEKMIAEYIEKVSPPTFWLVQNVKEYIVQEGDLG